MLKKRRRGDPLNISSGRTLLVIVKEGCPYCVQAIKILNALDQFFLSSDIELKVVPDDLSKFLNLYHAYVFPTLVLNYGRGLSKVYEGAVDATVLMSFLKTEQPS